MNTIYRINLKLKNCADYTMERGLKRIYKLEITKNNLTFCLIGPTIYTWEMVGPILRIRVYA